MFVVLAKYRTTAEKAVEVADLVRRLALASRSEPGNRGYEAVVSTEDPTSFALIEHYADRAAFEAHLASPHYEEIGVARIRPLLTSRSVDTWFDLAP